MREHMSPGVRHFLHQFRSWGFESGLQLVAASLVAKLPSYRVRHALYRAAGVTLAPKAHIYKGLEIRHPSGVTIGEDTVIGFDCILDGGGRLVIGDHVNLSSKVAIWTFQHDHRDPQFKAVGAPVCVGDYAWLSFRSTVLPGVTIGEKAVIAAGAVVTKDVPPRAIMVGIPAKQIGERNAEVDYQLAAQPHWFI